MPTLLSLLPPQSEAEKLESRQLVAKLHLSPRNLGSMYVNVLGGSPSRGGVALDPIVSSGRLKNDTKTEFAQLNRSYLPSLERTQKAGWVYVQLETLFPHSDEQGKKSVASEATKQQVSKNGRPLAKERGEYQGIQLGVFSAGSEGGFLVGEGGVMPWLCRIAASRVQLQVTGHKSGERRVPITKKPTHPSNLARHFAEIEAENKLNRFKEYLKNKGLLLDKRVVELGDGEIKMIPVLRQDPKAMRKQARARQTEWERERERQEALRTQTENENPIKSYGEWLSQENKKPRRGEKQPDNKLSEEAPSSSFRDTLGESRYKSLPPQTRWLLNHYPATQELILQNKIKSLPYRNSLAKKARGALKFGFVARERLATSQLARAGLRAGGFQLRNAIEWSRQRKVQPRKLYPGKFDSRTVTEDVIDAKKGKLEKVSVDGVSKVDGSGKEETVKVSGGMTSESKGVEASSS